MRTLIFQHTPAEGPGTLIDWLKAENLPYQLHFTHRGEPWPEAREFDWLIVLGGPMNTDEEHLHPWLKQEKQYLKDWLATGKATLGICLGGQLLAEALGGRVGRARAKELGFHEVYRTGADHPSLRRWPERMPVFQWHGDAFTLPPGCVSLLSSDACEHQAFARDTHTLGIQFHPESTRDWIEANYHELKIGCRSQGHVQGPADCLAQISHKLPPLTAAFYALLEDFVAGARAASRRSAAG